MNRLRTPLMAKIKNGEFEDFVFKLLSTEFKFDGHRINRDFPLEYEIDSLNRTMREAVYQKSRDLLLKIAPYKNFGHAMDRHKV